MRVSRLRPPSAGAIRIRFNGSPAAADLDLDLERRAGGVVEPPAVAHGLGWTGLLLVVLPGLFYNKSTAFPGMASWVPVDDHSVPTWVPVLPEPW